MCKVYNDKHKNDALSYQKNRRKTDETFALKCRMRARLADWIGKSGISKACGTFDMIGCSPSHLRDHLQSICDDFCTSVHHIDHVFPLDVYDITDEEMQKRAMHFSNTQPLPQSENSNKSNKLPTKAMAAKVERWAWPPGVTEDMLPDIYDGWATPLRM